MTNQDESIVELAETVKELVRIFQQYSLVVKVVSPNLALPPHLDDRLQKLYNKASRAKNRVNGDAS